MQDAQTLRRNFLWNTFGQLTYMLCQFLCGILVVRLAGEQVLSLIHISEPTRLGMISYAVFCLKKKNKEM